MVEASATAYLQSGRGGQSKLFLHTSAFDRARAAHAQGSHGHAHQTRATSVGNRLGWERGARGREEMHQLGHDALVVKKTQP